MTELEKHLSATLLQMSKQHVEDMRRLEQQNAQLSERVENLTERLHLLTERLDRLTHLLDVLSERQARF